MTRQGCRRCREMEERLNLLLDEMAQRESFGEVTSWLLDDEDSEDE